MERRLAAILAADVVGYSRLVRADEEGTLRALAACRSLIDERVAAHRGRVFASAGDSVYADFVSPVEAVRCAADVQRDLFRRNAELPEDRRMRFPIGINLGDVVIDGDDLLGDGVNVAARLEALADPGGICLSQPVYDQVGTKLDLGYEYLGAKAVKNIAEPVRVYRVLLDPASSGSRAGSAKPTARRTRRVALAAAVVVVVGAGAAVAWLRPWAPALQTASVERMALPLPDRPSVAVLPFTNMSGDPGQQSYADGLTDDLITDLSKVSGLFVIARNASFAYRGSAVEIRRVAEDLGVRYVLEGSVRRSDDQVRVNAQLIDATTGGHVWAERYDGSAGDVFAVQDAFVRKIVSALAVSLPESEKQEIARGQTANMDAHEAFQKGWAHYLRFTPADNAKSATHLKRAVALDAQYGRAYAALGMVYIRGCQWGWHEELGLSIAAASAWAKQYLAQAERHPSALTKVAASQIRLYNNRHDEALTEAARAIALDRNNPEAHIAMALAMITTGKSEAGLEFVETAVQLNPSTPSHYVLAHAMAYFSLHDLERAAAILSDGLTRDPGAVELASMLAATLAHLGRRGDARAALRLWRPDASQADLKDIGFRYHLPYDWPEDQRAVKDRLIDGLNVAGLPPDVTVASLVETLRRGSAVERRNAARTLGEFGPTAADAVPNLIEALADENRWVKTSAAVSLSKIGPAAKAAIPALEALLDDEALGQVARRSLQRIGRP